LVAIVRNPERQQQTLKSFKTTNSHLFLEKPLAPSLGAHRELLSLLVGEKKSFSVNYSFIETAWWKEVFKPSKAGDFSLSWHIERPSQQWKLSEAAGGGLVRYYAIHFTPALSLGFTASLINCDETRVAFLLESKHRLVRIEIMYAHEPHFQIRTNGAMVFSSLGPFGARPRDAKVDPRVGGLRKYLEDYPSNREKSHSLELDAISFLETLDSDEVFGA
jgi:hypothetical protein